MTDKLARQVSPEHGDARPSPVEQNEIRRDCRDLQSARPPVLRLIAGCQHLESVEFAVREFAGSRFADLPDETG